MKLGVKKLAGGVVLMSAVALACFPWARVSQGAGLLVAQGGLGGQLEIKEHKVEVTMNNGIVVTKVEQVFVNLEDRQVEALYTFPVPKGASVSNFSMWIGGREMVGEVVEKKRAREIYDSYKQKRRDPGLLEQVDYRTFEMRIFPIGPKAEQRVQLVYYQELEFDHDRATYVYPLASTAVKEVKAQMAGKFAMTVNARSEVPLVGMESVSHGKEFVLAKHDPRYYQASMEVSGGDLQKDVVLTYQQSRPKTGMDVICSKPQGEDGYFQATLTAGEELAPKDAGMDYVFVLDISGSMKDEGKLNLARKSVGAFVATLGKEDRFEIITFNVQATALFQELRTAEEGDGGTKAEALKFLEKQAAAGGTVLKPALTAAYRYADQAPGSGGRRPLNVVVISDGITEQSERAELVRVLADRPANVRAFAIGIGNDVNRALLEQVAEKTGGLAAFVSREDSFDRQAAAFRRKLMRPAMTDLHLTFGQGAVEVYDVEPAALGNLYHGMPVRVYGRYKGGGEVEMKLTGKISGKDFEKAAKVELRRDTAGENPEVERMWAWKKVDRLLKEADGRGDRGPVREEIVRLGEGYSLVTEYTSFLVLENDGEYQRWQIQRKNATRVARDRVAQEVLAKQLETLRVKAAEEMVAGVGRPERQVASAQGMPQGMPQAPAGPPPSAPVGPSRGFDLDTKSGGGGGDTAGGGAIDPVSAAMIAGLGAMGILGLRKRKSV